MVDNEIDALNYLVEQGRITNKEYWEKSLDVVNNMKWVLIKWANDVAILEANGLENGGIYD